MVRIVDVEVLVTDEVPVVMVQVEVVQNTDVTVVYFDGITVDVWTRYRVVDTVLVMTCSY